MHNTNFDRQGPEALSSLAASALVLCAGPVHHRACWHLGIAVSNGTLGGGAERMLLVENINIEIFRALHAESSEEREGET